MALEEERKIIEGLLAMFDYQWCFDDEATCQDCYFWQSNEIGCLVSYALGGSWNVNHVSLLRKKLEELKEG